MQFIKPKRAKLLKVGDVAEAFGIHKRTVYRLVERGELPSVRIGRSIRFDPEVVETWLADQRA